MKIGLYIVFFLLPIVAISQNWRDSLDLARKLYKEAQYDEALHYYQSAQKYAPENVDLSDEMAQSAYKARQFETAEKIYQQKNAVEKDRIQQANRYHNIGNSRMKKKDYSGAIDAYKESLRLNPGDDQTRYNLSEAIRQMKQQQQQQQQNQENSDDPKQQNSGENNSNPENQNSQNQKSNGSPSEKNKQDSQNKSQLPNKTVEKMLDNLMKQEVETKRKISGAQRGAAHPKSGKDW